MAVSFRLYICLAKANLALKPKLRVLYDPLAGFQV